ncbi:MAG: hypothetical protein K0Q89_237 [Thermomicrobiales bacterium]|nr:hypothetical protein [Thermomicrobiales bacterium]
MSRQIPSTSLAVTLSTKRVVLPARMVHQVATLAGFEGLDVDVTTSLGRWLGARLAASDLRNVPVRSLWVPAGDIHSPASRRLIGDIANRQSDSCLSVVATLPAGATLNELATHFALQEGVHNSLPVALGLPSTALKGGRPHLVQLGVIRRFAEEWNLSVAIDLSGQFDPTWEAEAAVSRLGERLTKLRISASAPSRAAVGRDRVACRALHAAMDRDHFLEVAVAPVKPVPFPITPRVASYGARRAADYIAERAVLNARALRDGISSYEGSHSSRGN